MTNFAISAGALDGGRVEQWLLAVRPDLVAPLKFDLVTAGRSNLTFRVTDGSGTAFALRRPPVGPVLATAHDMRREFAIVSALVGTDVPVPTPIAFCADASVIGAPFHVMEFVEGRVLRNRADCAGIQDTVLRAACDDLVGVLARLHRVDVDAVGLGNLGRRDSYIERQLRRWDRQFAGVSGGRTAALVRQVHRELAAAVPEAQRCSIVHGDYRLDNVIIDDAGGIQAVLDWELCTLGDPLADLGMLLTYWAPADGSPTPVPTATGSPGFPDRVDVAEQYARASQLDLSNLTYYVAFAHWKVVCILDGVYDRYHTGSGGGSQEGVDDYPELVATLAVKAHDILRGGLDVDGR